MIEIIVIFFLSRFAFWLFFQARIGRWKYVKDVYGTWPFQTYEAWEFNEQLIKRKSDVTFLYYKRR